MRGLARCRYRFEPYAHRVQREHLLLRQRCTPTTDAKKIQRLTNFFLLERMFPLYFSNLSSASDLIHVYKKQNCLFAQKPACFAVDHRGEESRNDQSS